MKNIKWQFLKLDDIKVKYKLALLYVLGVLIPVLITNYWLYNSINTSVKKEQVNSISESMNRIMFNLKSDFENSIAMTDVFYNDYFLNTSMDKSYGSQLEYLEVFNSYLRNFISKYLPLYNQINNVNVYVDNHSIINGGGYEYLSNSIKEQDWYNISRQSKKRIEIVTYYDGNLKSIIKNTGRFISILRKLNGYTVEKSVEKFLKVDMDYDLLNSKVLSESINGDIFIVDAKGNIVMSNNPYYTNSTQDYLPYSSYSIPKKYITMEKPLTGVLSGWKIIINVKRADLLSTVKSSRLNLILMLFVNLVMPSFLILFISRSFNNRLTLISKHIKHMEVQEFTNIECTDGKDEIGQVINEFNRMTVKIKELIKDVYQERIKRQNVDIARQQAELNALQSQINPHFLFNTLETIRMRSLIKKEKETAEIIMHLSKMLRRALTWGDDMVSVKEEINVTEDFLKIQEYRFGEKLNYKIEVQEGLVDCLIPKLSILTFVENACIHGIENITGKGLVEVTVASRDDGYLNVNIKDNGIGIPEEKLVSLLNVLRLNTEHVNPDLNVKSVGMRNVCTRFYIFYKGDFKIDVVSEVNKGTEVSFHIPLNEKSFLGQWKESGGN